MTTHTQAACAGSIISVLFLSAFIYVPTADASRGSSDDRIDERSEEFRESGSDDGTLDQGSGDFGDDSKSDSSDDGTPDQGRGDFDAMGTIIDDSPDRFVDDAFNQGSVQISDDGTADQGRGDNPSASSNDEDIERLMKQFRVWFLTTFSWLFS